MADSHRAINPWPHTPWDDHPGPITGRQHVYQNAIIYTAASGALVFDAGTYNFAQKIDDNDHVNLGVDPRVQIMTLNLLSHMLATPNTTSYFIPEETVRTAKAKVGMVASSLNATIYVDDFLFGP